jgi:hypothetical protein
MRKLQNKGLHDFYLTHSSTAVDKSMIMALVGHVEGMGERKNAGNV